MKLYKIVVNGEDYNTYVVKEVQGSPVDVGAAPFSTFVHRVEKAGKVRMGWAVSEVTSGNSISPGLTRKEAIENAIAMVKRVGPEMLSVAVDRQVAFIKSKGITL